MKERREPAATAAADTATAVITTAGSEPLSGLASGSDVTAAADTASKERKRCHTGGLQHQQQHNSNGPPTASGW